MDEWHIVNEQYQELQLLVADQVRDNELTEAAENIRKMKRLQVKIDYWENLDVPIHKKELFS